MKEDILEQLIDDYLQHQGYFTRHNIRFRPGAKSDGYDSRQDSVSSDIDVIGFHPRLNGPPRVMVVSSKSWQSGFRPAYYIDKILSGATIGRREAWRGFRELANEKWAAAFRARVFELTGETEFTYVTAVTKLIGDRAIWTENEVFRANMGGNPIQILTFGEMLNELWPALSKTPAGSELGRMLQLMKASGFSPDP